MKAITMFIMSTCPHCKRVQELMAELFAEHPEYNNVPLTVIDEVKSPEIAAKYDYYYVPTFYVGDEKMMEGVPSKEKVENVFNAALGKAKE